MNIIDHVIHFERSGNFNYIHHSRAHAAPGGHAVAVLLYELHRDRVIDKEATVASEMKRDRLLDAFEDLLDVTGYPPHKRKSTEVMIRRIIGRATLSKWEFHTMMGVIRRPVNQVRRLEDWLRAEGLDPKPKRKKRPGRAGPRKNA